MARYTSKHALQPLFGKPFFLTQCTYNYNLKTSGRMWKFSILNDYNIIGDIFCVDSSYTRDPTGELRSETCIGHSVIRRCVHILQDCINFAIWYKTTSDNRTHVPYDCVHVLHTKWCLYWQ